MRIAIITPSVSRTGGTEKCLSWLAEDLSHTCEVTMLAGEMAGTDTSRARVHLLPMVRHPRLLRYVSFLISNTAALALRRVLRKPKFDVVLATAGDCLFSNVVYAHFCCAAWLAMLHDERATLPASSLKQRLRNLHYRVFLQVASAVECRIYHLGRVGAIVAVSAGIKRELVAHYGIPPSRIAVVPNAVDERVRLSTAERIGYRREIRATLRIPDNAMVLLFVAAGDWKRKGLLLVLEALALLTEHSSYLLVVGREDLAFYQAEAARLGVAERVRFCGFTTEIERYYAAADVFVYPSAYEAFSLVTLEAAGAGLPLVVTRVNGTEELVEEGVNGLFVEPDAAAIAAALRCLLADPALLDRMAAAAAQTGRRFTRAAVAERILALCIEQSAARPLSAAGSSEAR